jgi:hypothetical protein
MVYVSLSFALQTIAQFNSMELRPSWEVASCPATLEAANILWNPKLYYFDEKLLSLTSVIKTITLYHTSILSILILFSH